MSDLPLFETPIAPLVHGWWFLVGVWSLSVVTSKG